MSGVRVSDDDGLNGSALTRPYDVPRISLTATDGSAYSLTADTEERLTLVFFGYTRCPDICQAVMADIASALTRLTPEQRDQVGMLFITSDPARDDAKTLRAYLDRFDPTFEGLTGGLRRITVAGDALGVPIEQGRRLPSGGYEVVHGTQIIGVNAKGQAPVVWTEGTSAASLAEDITTLLADDSLLGAA